MDSALASAREETARGENPPFLKIFEAQAGLVLLLNPELKIQAASDAYLRETLTKRKDIIGKHVFTVFPDNPEEANESPTKNLMASFEQIFATGKSHKMEIIRYDIPDPERPGYFVERYWSTCNTPVLDDQGNITCIIHETNNVTESEKAKRQLLKSQQREQTALAQAEQHRIRLERLFDQAPAALAILEGPELVYKVINKAYQHLFPGRQLMGLGLFEALPELKNQPIDNIIRTVYETGETFEGKEVLIPVARYEGQAPEDIYWNFIYQALYDTQGQINGVLIFALDVTEFVKARQQAEKSAEILQTLNQQLEEKVIQRTKALQLAQAEAEKQKHRLERLFTDAPAAICILDGSDMVFELVNPTYQQLFPGRQLGGKPILEGLPEVEGTVVHQTLLQVYETGITHQEEEMCVPFVRPLDGVVENRYFKYIQQPRYNEHGLIDGILVLAFEVTEQVESRRAVEASARQLRLITDSLPVLIGYLDKDEVYRFTNKAYETWFPHKAESILGRKVRDVVGDKAYQNVKVYIERALAGERLDFEATMPYKDGFTKHIRTSYVPDIQEGKVAGFYTLVTDVTEQVESRLAIEKSEKEAKAMAEELAATNEELASINEELQDTNQQLTHTNSDLDNFIYTASHDLKAPISNIEMLMAELLVELPKDSLAQGEVETIIGMMKGAIDRFKKTIKNLTEITKLQKDHLIETKVVSVKEVVQEVILDMEQMIQKSEAQLDVELNKCPFISFSEKNLRSIFYNLLSNAIKYRHPARKPFIQVRCHLEKEYLVLTVQDNGLGLSSDEQKKLFTMFRRFHDHVEGSGVGLYMVKRMVDNAGGKIEVDSQKGEGATFKVYLKNNSFV
ncbi:PAS domain-containing protein [Rufibacter tibetensis]|uniref:histidine kinase n=1 Tax=Rufibacter tibetensis TaxID=512763 RepID=A0A0N7HWQ8_9BACT|nr:PAS domain-containing protein [Rufibacter tibetensis]ALI99928.1 phytochrome-like protein cph1 [Rufibacter tibetensis]